MELFNTLVDFIVKPTLVLSVFILVLKLSHIRSASIIHSLLTLGVLVSIVTIVCAPLFHYFDIYVSPESYAYLIQLSLEGIGQLSGLDKTILVTLYLVITFILLSGFIFTLFKTYLIVLNSRQLDSPALRTIYTELTSIFSINRKVTFKQTDDIQSPAIWGVHNISVLLPHTFNDWDESRLRRIIAHELAHIKRFDWLIKLAVCSACCVFWFVIPIWWVKRKINWYSEFSADDAVIRALDCRADYANDLLDVSTHISMESNFLVAFIKRSEVFQRIHCVLNSTQDRSELSVHHYLPAMFFSLALSFPLITSHFKLEKIVVSNANYYPIQIIKNLDIVSSYSLVVPYSLNREPYQISDSPLVVKAYVDETDYSTRASQPSISMEKPLENIVVDITESGLTKPERLHFIIPTYPDLALTKGIETKVKAVFTIDQYGYVSDIKVLPSAYSKLFERSIKRALSISTYIPLHIDGRPATVKNVSEVYKFKIVPKIDVFEEQNNQ